MAKRKLSESQRSAIRKELALLLRNSKTKAEAYKAVAKKFGITPMTARWYANTLQGAPSPGAKSAKRPKLSPRRPGARKTRASANGRAPNVGGGLQHLVAGVAAAAGRALSRARLAQKLVPRWRLFVKKHLSLRKIERKVRQELRAVAQRAHALEQRIKDLTSR